MYKANTSILVIVLFTVMIPARLFALYSGGSGTEIDPYQIREASDWLTLMNNSGHWKRHFVLVIDLDLDGIELKPVARDLFPRSPGFQGTSFTGSLDGNGYKICNIVIETPANDYVGLFGLIEESGEVRNVHLEDVTIKGRSYVGGLVGMNKGKIVGCSTAGLVTGYDHAGGLAGWNNSDELTYSHSSCIVAVDHSIAGGLIAENRGSVEYCNASGEISSSFDSGGLVGRNSGLISRCYATGNITEHGLAHPGGGLVGNNTGEIISCFSKGEVIGSMVGGLVGENSGDVFFCYATGSVHGRGNTGGFVGKNSGNLSMCFSSGLVDGPESQYLQQTGGLVGTGSSMMVSDCFWDIDTSNWNTSASGIGKTTNQMKTRSTFVSAGWDFNDRWMIWDGYDYPHLQWEQTPNPPIVFVDIPGGTFEMGNHLGDGRSDELPVHTVTLDSFKISKYETTNAQYADYLNASLADGLIQIVDGSVYAVSDPNKRERYFDTHSSDERSQILYTEEGFIVRSREDHSMDDHPVTEVSWYGAKAFCDYYGYRLPTEAEWEYAARGGYHNPYYKYPWGNNEIDCSKANYNQCNPLSLTTYPYTSIVGYYGEQGAYGLCDMCGNVWEWCHDRFDSNYYSVSPETNPMGSSEDTTRRVLRGGSWSEEVDNYISHRGRALMHRCSWSFGFRVCVQSFAELD